MILTENQHTPTMRLVASVNCLQKINIFIVADIIMTSVNFCCRHGFFCGCYNSVSVHSNGMLSVFDIESCTCIFFSRCLQTVLPHIHLLWELALTNEVLIVQMLKKHYNYSLFHVPCRHSCCYPSFCDNACT